MPNEIIKYGFSGHETFAFRYGWLKKGIDAVQSDPNVFNSEDAIVRLGVGKNMVRSIRYWCLATRLITDQPEPDNQHRILRLTEIGTKLLSDDGWDPYLEDTASLWLIHWLLITSPERAAVWHITFTRFIQFDFTRRELLRFITSFIEGKSTKVNQNSISRDIDCLIHTYISSRNTKDNLIEDSLDCPLVELGIIQPMYDTDTYRFNKGPKASLPVHILGFALNDYFNLVADTRQTINFQDCLYGKDNLYEVVSPGQVFKLDENSLIDYIETLQSLTSGDIQIDETAGLKQIYRRRSLDSIQLLEDYYSKKKA